jgi:DeoR/GlpR family transcriptional regulator of sugar metabolism
VGGADAARDKVARRRARLRRLLDEAARQGAFTPEAELAAVLGVSMRTIKRDMASLRQERA